MSDTPRRLSDIVQDMLAERGWRVGPSAPTGAASTKDPAQLVFVGNWQDPCPRRLLFDPDLEPVDIVTWQVIRVHADARKLVAFPSYTELMRALRVSRATVARALAVLRLTRWLPLCAALRDAQGRFAGHVYALNDEPLPLAEILALDGAYLSFAEQAQRHRSAHVGALARSVLESIHNDAIAPDGEALEPVRVADHVAHRLDQLLRLAGDHVQILNSVHRVQNLNSVRSSSIYKKTTTTDNVCEPSGDRPRAPRERTEPAALIFPDALSLTDSQRRVLTLRLEALPNHLRQDVLDEAAGRILGKRATADPVRCEFDYTARLGTRALNGQFVLTDAGERVRRQRRERGETEERLRRAREYSEAQRLKAYEAFKARDEGESQPLVCSNLERK